MSWLMRCWLLLHCFLIFASKGKPCDEPLLHNERLFPDEIFSGSGGSNYEEARISKSGWCPTGAEKKYLMIDLQKEYRITQILILGGRNHTNFSEFYSLQYSHETLKDGSNKIKINGSKTRHQASTTNVMMLYNVRYIKIESTKIQDYCLRIELCGKVQKPQPVENLIVTPSSFSALASWTIPGPEKSSYIIKYRIWLSLLPKKAYSYEELDRKTLTYRDEFNMTGLMPNTDYEIVIRTEDNSSKSYSIGVNVKFTTKEAVEGVNGNGDNGNGDRTNDGNQKKRLNDENSGGSIGVIVGASVGGTVIVVTVFVLAVIFLKRRIIHKPSTRNKTVSNENGDEMQEMNKDGSYGQDGQPTICTEYINLDTETGYVEEKGHPPVPVAEFACYVNKMKANDNQEFEIEFDALPKMLDTSWEVAKKPFNKNKNRYENIVTYDYSRVVLSGDEEEDYINASYIDGMCTNSYIATQGPNKLTVKDIWRMVWEQRSYSIVMVTSLVELGKSKCEKYWPDQGSEMYGDIEVTLMRTEEVAFYVTRTLQLKRDGEEREVRHYFFSSWPDHGVPKCPTQLLTFRRHFRVYHLEETGPVLVHCSAGVGRTGVFIAIDNILEKLQKGVIDSVDVFGQVSTMRERRMNMIQTLEQYIFVHEAILETILCGINEIGLMEIQKEIEKLSTVKASGMTGFQEKFKRLNEVSSPLSPEECTAALIEGNLDKTRNKSVLPAECNRVSLQYVEGVENSDYINAVFVHGYFGKKYFIATQSPLPNTINDFWRMVFFENSSTIVLLNNVKAGKSFPKFWPTRRGIPMQYENLTVQLDSETQSNSIWTRKFIVAPYLDLTDGRVVNVFQYTQWPDHHVPANPGDIITLTSLVEKSRQRHGQGPIIVACSDGAGRTGTYITISNLLERMKIEQAVDVFQAIKIIRGARPQFVENAEQYQFCYTAMMEYLEGFSDYANFE